MRLSLIPVVAFALACGNADKFDTDTDVVCGGNAPTFEGVDFADIGTATIGGSDKQVMQISVNATDVDGDLTTYKARIWHDTLPDGKLPEQPNSSVPATISDVACGVDSATVGAVLPMGGDIPLGTQVEFGIVVEDALGHASNNGDPVIAVWETPTE